jgi:hypothetical protein
MLIGLLAAGVAASDLARSLKPGTVKISVMIDEPDIL